MWLAGQISTRLGFVNTKTVILSYIAAFVVFFIIGFIVAVAGLGGGAIFLFYIPYSLAFIFLIILRVKFVEKFEINENNLESCLWGFFCGPCSLCQMARHMYGYTKVFDGDSDPEGMMTYTGASGTAPPFPSTAFAV